MSTIKTDLLQNRLGTSHPAVTKADFVKAWASANQQGTQTAPAKFNVTSITDIGVGVTRFELTAGFISGYFTPMGSNNNGVVLVGTVSASQAQLTCFSVAASPVATDVTLLSFAAYGDLA